MNKFQRQAYVKFKANKKINFTFLRDLFDSTYRFTTCKHGIFLLFFFRKKKISF